MTSMSNVQAIKKLFQRKDSLSPNGQNVPLAEFRALTAEDREELGKQAKEELANPSVKVYE